MQSSSQRSIRWLTGNIALVFSLSVLAQTTPAHAGDTASFIVQGRTADVATAAVEHAGGSVTSRLDIIDGVVASVDNQALARLRADTRLALHANVSVRASGLDAQPQPSSTAPAPLRGGGENDGKEGKTKGYLLYPSAATGATALHSMSVPTIQSPCAQKRVTVTSQQQSQPLQGYGVTVAFVDSGFVSMNNASTWINRDSANRTLETEAGGRCVVYRDFLPATAENGNSGTAANNSVDQNGHGTHVIGSVADFRAVQMADKTKPAPIGVAPQVNLLIARALDKNGAGTYADVISAIQWVVQNKSTYNVRVLNLSLYSPVTGPYWADPLNQAVMKAWQSGIVVVVAAGNSGPTAGTVTVPGNVPYVITVGAIKSGRYTTSGYDELATYSSRGPTESAFVKPDVLVPASQTIAPIPDGSTLAQQIPAAAIQEKIKIKDAKLGELFVPTTYYRLSGTSMASAQVSGIVALMLQANPNLTNDQVKFRLMATAQPAIDTTTGQSALTFWEQGAGMVDTQQAVFNAAPDSANAGMDINADLTTDTHYWGFTTWDQASGQFQLIDPANGQLLVWDGAGRMWSGAGRMWSGAGRMWSGAGRMWSGGTNSWTGSSSLWAGSTRIWAGSTPTTSLNTAARTELLPNN